MKTNVKNYGIENGKYFLIEPNTGVKVICDNYRQFTKYFNRWYLSFDALQYKETLKRGNFPLYTIKYYRNGKIRFVSNNATGLIY